MTLFCLNWHLLNTGWTITKLHRNDICIIHFQNWPKISIPCGILVDLAVERITIKPCQNVNKAITEMTSYWHGFWREFSKIIEVYSSTNSKTFHIYDIHIISSFEIYLPGNLSTLFAKLSSRWQNSSGRQKVQKQACNLIILFVP